VEPRERKKARKEQSAAARQVQKEPVRDTGLSRLSWSVFAIKGRWQDSGIGLIGRTGEKGIQTQEEAGSHEGYRKSSGRLRASKDPLGGEAKKVKQIPFKAYKGRW